MFCFRSVCVRTFCEEGARHPSRSTDFTFSRVHECTVAFSVRVPLYLISGRHVTLQAHKGWEILCPANYPTKKDAASVLARWSVALLLFLCRGPLRLGPVYLTGRSQSTCCGMTRRVFSEPPWLTIQIAWRISSNRFFGRLR